MSKFNLKLCPFCGGEAEFSTLDMSIFNPANSGDFVFFYGCPKCGAVGPERKTPKEAAEAWNRRIN